ALAMTDETTTVIWNQNYLPFGEPHGGSGVIENSRQYTGKEFEEETGLYYYGARYYHSGLGRFMSVDPAPADPTDPQSWNRYAYVLNNPYKYVDPDGQIAVNVSGLVELNSRVRNKLGFIPDFILDALLPVESHAIVASSLLEPQALGIGAISKGVSSTVKLVNKTEKLNVLSKPSKVPYAGGFLRSFVTTKDEIYYRVFSGDNTTGAFLTKVKPKRREYAIEGLSLPPWNNAEFIQEVLVPAGTRLLRSRALPVPQFGRFRGGLEQFELLERIPVKNFGPGIPFE
ncbi:MAG TPA: RHS repeat-associated core domain-containing protein, partial [Thermodesulfobacteriota bacterium]|nr:RHS repeat-associated core domain-containing protein [Thermodesulfobacteriota bacterium]